MPAYSYKGLSKTGKDVKGVREAASKQALTNELLNEGIFVSSIQETGAKSSKYAKLQEMSSLTVLHTEHNIKRIL